MGSRPHFNRSSYWLAVGVICALAAVNFSCSGRPRIVEIGVALSNRYWPALDLAVREINEAKGIAGVQLKLFKPQPFGITSPDSPDIAKWASIAEARKELVAVIGHPDSSSTLAAAAFYNEKHIPQIVTTATNPSITNIGEWTFRLCLSDALQGPSLADYAVSDWGKRRIAVFYVNDPYGRVLAHMFENRVKELGGVISSSVLHRNALQEQDRELIEATISRWKTEGLPDLVVLFQRQDAAIWTAEAMKRDGVKSDLLCGDAVAVSQLITGHASIFEGARFSQFFFPRPSDPRATKFAEDLKAITHADLDYGDALAYDAVFLLRDAIREGGSSREGVRSYLTRLIRNRTTVEGVSGPYVIGKDHDARRAFCITELRGGVQHLIKEIPVK